VAEVLRGLNSVHAGWFLHFTRRNGMQDFLIRVFDGTLCALSFAAWS
jgi:hypothetical protein